MLASGIVEMIELRESLTLKFELAILVADALRRLIRASCNGTAQSDVLCCALYGHVNWPDLSLTFERCIG